MSLKKIVKEILSTLLIIFVISMVLNYVRKPDTSDKLVNIKMLDIYNKRISLLKLEKKDAPTVVHFWATWCPTCKLEAPNLEALRSSCNVVSIAVNSGSNELLQSFMKERDLGYRVINDNDAILAKKFGVEVYPTTFIYDSNGTLKFSEVGYSTTMGLKARIALIRD
ncbi:MAG: redoxin domain-containing protein [Sulfurovaceae bacterium]|nr:redoxin domain-containing protein [Sulfurovaceae bacterium]